VAWLAEIVRAAGFSIGFDLGFAAGRTTRTTGKSSTAAFRSRSKKSAPLAGLA
jgi:hypothetical protein